MAGLEFTERDLLIQLNERIDGFLKTFKEHVEQSNAQYNELWREVSDLKSWRDKQSGFFSGAKMLWGILGSLPPSVVVFLLVGIDKF